MAKLWFGKKLALILLIPILVSANYDVSATSLRESLALENKFNGVVQGGNQQWPVLVEIKFTRKNSSRFSGRMTWKTLGSIVKIDGRIRGNKLTFKSTAHIKRGQSVIGTTFTLSPSASGLLVGTWSHRQFIRIQGKYISLQYDNTITTKQPAEIAENNQKSTKDTTKTERKTRFSNQEMLDMMKKRLTSELNDNSKDIGRELTVEELEFRVFKRLTKRNCKNIECFQEAEKAYDKKQLEFARDLYGKYVNISRNQKQKNIARAKKRFKELKLEYPLPRGRVEYDRYGMPVGSPEQEYYHKKHGYGKYAKQYFKKQISPVEWHILSNSIKEIGALRERTQKLIVAKKLSEKEANSIVQNKFLPMADSIGSTILKNTKVEPKNAADFNKAAMEMSNLNGQFHDELYQWVKSKIGSVSHRYAMELIEAKNEFIDSSSQNYLKVHINRFLDVDAIISQIHKLSWSPIAPKQFLWKKVPAVSGKDKDNYLDQRIWKAINAARKNQKDTFKALPQKSEPKLFLASSIKQVKNAKNFKSALQKLKVNDTYFLDWPYRTWPAEFVSSLVDKASIDIKESNSVLEAFETLGTQDIWTIETFPEPLRRAFSAANLKRLSHYESKEKDDIQALEKDDIVYTGGLIIGKSNLLDSVNGYLSEVERLMAMKGGDIEWGRMMVDALAKRSKTKTYTTLPKFMGLFEYPYAIGINRRSLSESTESVCISYQATQKRGSIAVDCLFFENNLLAGFSFDRSSSQCISTCEYHKIDINHFSKFGFKMVDEITKGIRLWRKLERGNIRFAYKLWGGQRKYIKDSKKGLNGVYASQNATICLFKKSIESVLKENEKNGRWSCS
jgi:hypothetical protein